MRSDAPSKRQDRVGRVPRAACRRYIDMKKKLVIALAVALVLCCAGIGVWAAGNYGSEDDPLVAMSYLDKVKEQL